MKVSFRKICLIVFIFILVAHSLCLAQEQDSNADVRPEPVISVQNKMTKRDVLALVQFITAVSIVVVLFLFLLKRKAFMSLFPTLPNRAYQGFVNLLRKFYYPVMLVSLFAGLLWCFGYCKWVNHRSLFGSSSRPF